MLKYSSSVEPWTHADIPHRRYNSINGNTFSFVNNKKSNGGASVAEPEGPDLVDDEGVLCGVQTAQAAHIPQHWARGALKIRDSVTEHKNYSQLQPDMTP